MSTNSPADLLTTSANSAGKWNELWASPETTDWRGAALAPVYKRIVELMPAKSRVLDFGGGVGMLAKCLQLDGHYVEVRDISNVAIASCKKKGISAEYCNLETDRCIWIEGGSVVIATEVLEHLTLASLHRFLDVASKTARYCFFSVPNDRLTPAEEPQHASSWTAKEFLDLLRFYFPHVRVEVLGPAAAPNPAFPSDRGQPAFLLGVCGFEKKASLSVCWPARDEEKDIERCLASFRGVADDLVIGIDPRSKDKTKELALKYADVVFNLTEPEGPEHDRVPDGGFHFAHARNQCMDRCSGDWIFMTEAHEPLVSGQDALLHLDQVEDYVQVINVVRQGGIPPHREQWLFPWLCRNRNYLRYKRSTHNTLDYPDSVIPVTLPEVKTLHVRVHDNAVKRQGQRKLQNRVKLMEDWLKNDNPWSLQYLGTEWRDYDKDRAIRYLREYLAVSKYGTYRYNTRLELAKCLAAQGLINEAREALHPASGDDWSRIEHWIYLGDLAFEEGKYQEALSYYLYASTKYRSAPLIPMWVDLAMYTWIPAMRLAQTYAELGELEHCLHWARIVRDEFASFGDDVPKELITEAEDNVKRLEEATNGTGQHA